VQCFYLTCNCAHSFCVVGDWVCQINYHWDAVNISEQYLTNSIPCVRPGVHCVDLVMVKIWCLALFGVYCRLMSSVICCCLQVAWTIVVPGHWQYCRSHSWPLSTWTAQPAVYILSQLTIGAAEVLYSLRYFRVGHCSNGTLPGTPVNVLSAGLPLGPLNPLKSLF